MDKVLSIKNGSQRFYPGTVREVVAIDNIDLDLGAGDFVILVGSNGSGKSSLMKALFSGQMTSGSILYQGADITALDDYRRARFMGMVTQSPEEGTATELTVAENLALACARNRRRSFRKALNKRVKQNFNLAMEQIGLEFQNRLDSPVEELSGGERQMVCVLMALCASPEVLFLDEPTASIDTARCALIESVVLDYARRSQAPVIWITHDPEQALRLGNRLIVMQRGRLIADIDSESKRKLGVSRIGDWVRE